MDKIQDKIFLKAISQPVKFLWWVHFLTWQLKKKNDIFKAYLKDGKVEEISVWG